MNEASGVHPEPHEARFALPVGPIVVRTLIASVVATGVGCVGSLAVGEPVLGALVGGAALLGNLVGPLSIQPWRPRVVAKWAAHLLAAQVISLVSVTSFGVLLYLPTRPTALALAAVVTLGFVLAQILQVGVLKSAIADLGHRADVPAQG